MLASAIARPAAWLPAILAVGSVAFLVGTGVGAVSALALTLTVLVQAAAGATIWRAVRGQASPLIELVGMGLALGTVLSAIAGVASTWILGTPWGWLVVPGFASLIWIRGRRSERPSNPDEVQHGLGSLIVLVGSLGLGVLSLVPNVVNYPLRWSGTLSGYHGDMLFFESLSTSVAQYGPADSIFSPDLLIRYHWLTYAWAGQISASPGTEPFVVLVRVLPFVSVIGSVLIAMAWVRRLSKVNWAPLLAVVLLVLGGYVGATYGTIFNFDSPSQSMTTMWLLAFALAITVMLEPGRDDQPRSVPLLALLAALSFGLAAGKVSSGVVVGGAVAWLALVGMVKSTKWRKASVLVAAVSVPSLFLGYVLVVAGSADPGGLNIGSLIDRASSIQGLNPVPGSLGVALGTVLLLIAITARWAGVLWFVADRRTRWDSVTQMSIGFALAAIATVVLLSGGMNDTWFALGASAPLAVVSAAGVAEATRALGSRDWRRSAFFLVVAGLLFVLVFGLWASGASGGNVWTGTLRWLGPLAGVLGAGLAGGALGAWWSRTKRGTLAGSLIVIVLVAAPSRLLGVGTGQVGVQPGLGSDAFSPVTVFVETRDRALVGAWSESQVQAARLLREKTNRDDRVATNVTLSALVPALSQRQTWVSGIHYQAPYGTSEGIATLLDREQASWAAIDEASPDVLSELCDNGVTWLWVDPLRSPEGAWRQLSGIAYEADDVALIDLTAGCPS